MYIIALYHIFSRLRHDVCTRFVDSTKDVSKARSSNYHVLLLLVLLMSIIAPRSVVSYDKDVI